MKTLMVVLLSSMCLGQQSPMMTTPWHPPDHPEHASAYVVLPSNSYAVAKGEQPTAEVYKPEPEVSLGERAKLCRENPKDNRCIYKGEL